MKFFPLLKATLILLSCAICINLPALGQRSIAGQVMDESNSQPLLGVNVILLNSLRTVATNTNGEFAISRLPQGNQLLVFSFIGYASDTLLVDDTSSFILHRLKPSSTLVPEVTISSTRADATSAMAHSTLDKSQLQGYQAMEDMPQLLSGLPSVVTTSDAGTGIGYSGLRIRGSDATRINVTINGVPLNDAESQGVYWVDLPDFASSVENIQVQRGVGSSTNGAGAFGGSVNVLTSNPSSKSYGSLSAGAGAFNTLRTAVNFGTGLKNNHWAMDGRLSKISSDGYVDRASADLKSYFLSGGYQSKKTIVRATAFSGWEETYQAWYGTPQDSLITNPTFNPAGIHFDANGNLKFYENEIDHYQQDHYQLLWAQTWTPKTTAQLTFHYTKGRGYFEQYKTNELLESYSIQPVINVNDTVYFSDLIRQLWLDNDFYGAVYSLHADLGRKLKLNMGGALSRYEGQHFGEVIWARNAGSSEIKHRFYDNNSEKQDFNIYSKVNYRINSKLSTYFDLQIRTVQHEYLGINRDFDQEMLTDKRTFFNPKAGTFYKLNNRSSIYGSVSVGNKEPSREDFVSSSPVKLPTHESMVDYEAGYRYNANKISLGFNLYYMDYENQLIATGSINDVGEYIRTNVPESYRLGIELEAEWKPSKIVNHSFNLTLSNNKIESIGEYADSLGTDYSWIDNVQIAEHRKSDIAYSPKVVANSNLSVKPFSKVELLLMTKYVGKQFLDNTSSGNRKIDAYLVNNLRMTYQTHKLNFEEIKLGLQVNNILNSVYQSNGYTYSYYVGQELVTENYYYPQAGIHAMLFVNFKF